MTDKYDTYNVQFGPVFVQWEHLFAIDKKRVENGKRVGDDRYSMRVLLPKEAAEIAYPVIARAAAQVDEANTQKLALKRMQPVEDDALKEKGLLYSMKVYSAFPVDVLKADGTELNVPEIPENAMYRQFGYGLKQGHKLHLQVGFRGYVSPEATGVSAFLNGVFLHPDDPIEIPGGKPGVRAMFGHLVDTDAKPAGNGGGFVLPGL